MSRAGFGQQVFQNRTGRFLVIAMFGGSRGRTERLFEKRDADALRYRPLAFSVAGRPRLALHHLGKQGQTDADDFAFFSQASDRLLEKVLLFLARFAEILRQGSEGPPKCRQHFLGMAKSERDRPPRNSAFEQSDFQLSHEPSRRHPEIIPHHDDALDPAAIALPQGLHQVRVFFFLPGMEPLLELVQDDQHLLANRNALASPQCRQRCFEAQVVFQCRTTLSQSMQQTGFGFFRCGFDVNGDHVFGEPRQQSRLDQ